MISFQVFKQISTGAKQHFSISHAEEKPIKIPPSPKTYKISN